MKQRLIQNFGGMRALVVAPFVPDALQTGLLRLGLLVVHVPELGTASDDCLSADRDLMIIDGDPGMPPALTAFLAEPLPVPVVGLVGTEAPSRLRILITAGATAFIRKPVHAGAVYSSLFLAINGFRQRQHADERLAEHERRRRARRYVIKAILRTMQQSAIDDDAAYEILRRRAMHERVGLEDYCEAWLAEAITTEPEKRHA